MAEASVSQNIELSDSAAAKVRQLLETEDSSGLKLRVFTQRRISVDER